MTPPSWQGEDEGEVIIKMRGNKETRKHPDRENKGRMSYRNTQGHTAEGCVLQP